MSNAYGTVTSRVATLSLLPGSMVPPLITNQPVSVTTNLGVMVRFTVGATGSPDLTYRWWFNGTNALVSTTASLTLPTLSSNLAGLYHVVVSNRYGVVTSSVVTLAIQPSTAVAPTITRQPENVATNAGQIAQFKVLASGTAPMTYRWFNSAGTQVGSSEKLVFSTVLSNQAGDYYAVISNSVGSVTSSVATLTVLQFMPTLRLVRHTTYEGDLLYLILEPLKTYSVQYSSNTVNWVDFAAFTCASSPMYLTNRAATNTTRLYYRLGQL